MRLGSSSDFTDIPSEHKQQQIISTLTMNVTLAEESKVRVVKGNCCIFGIHIHWLCFVWVFFDKLI